jgi:hypothetical protein
MTTANQTSIAQALSSAQAQHLANAIHNIGVPPKARIIPTGTMAKLAVQSGTSFFDPIDLLEDHLGVRPVLHARVLESMVWMIDNSCISQARSILFTRYAEVDHDAPDAFSSFCQDVAENLDHESLYTDESPEQTLAILLALRDQWHDAAARAAAADDRDYKPKSLRQMMEEEKVKLADVGTRVNYKKLAELEAGSDTAKAERLYNSYMEADAIASTQRVSNNKALMPTILEVLRTAKRYALESSRFDHLPLSVQRRLTTFAVGVVDRCKLDVAKRLAKQPIAFGHVAEAAHQATVALNHVIASKFSDAGEMENVTSQTEINIGRNAKRVACSID